MAKAAAGILWKLEPTTSGQDPPELEGAKPTACLNSIVASASIRPEREPEADCHRRLAMPEILKRGYDAVVEVPDLPHSPYPARGVPCTGRLNLLSLTPSSLELCLSLRKNGPRLQVKVDLSKGHNHEQRLGARRLRQSTEEHHQTSGAQYKDTFTSDCPDSCLSLATSV